MERVDLTFKNGHTRIMAKRQAELLGKAGYGTYQTRDMARQPMLTKPMQAAAIDRTEKAPEVEPQADADGLDALDKDELHALAKERGVRVHHMAGADKVRAALREAA
jgi:hypothetical protein